MAKMKLVRATEEDSDLLNQFYESTKLPGSIHLGVKRPQGFFKPYQLQTDNFATYMLLNSNDEVKALASILFRKGWVDGAEQMIGYATDLRVASSRSAVLQWSQHFLPALEQEREKHNCKYVFSVVAHGQRQAYNAFIRPRSPKRQMPRYYTFRSFKIMLLHGLYPFAPKPLKTIETKKAEVRDTNDLVDYLIKKRKAQPYSFDHTREEVLRAIDRWEGLQLEDFWISRDSYGKVVGCTAPWSSQGIQDWSIDKFEKKGKQLHNSLFFASLIGLAHRFPNVGENIDFKYLTHLNADNPDIFYSLLWNAYQGLTNKQFLTYPRFNNDLIAATPKAFVRSSTKADLHCILSPNEKPPELLRPTGWGSPPHFELCFF